MHSDNVIMHAYSPSPAKMDAKAYVDRNTLATKALQENISPLAVFQSYCLRRICGISLCVTMCQMDVLNRCNTFRVKPQLRKRPRWLAHEFRMSNDRLRKKLLFDQLKGHRL